MKLHYLPEELIPEILRRLPVKSVLRFRSVSKSWNSLVKSSDFINTHLRNNNGDQYFACTIPYSIPHAKLNLYNIKNFREHIQLQIPSNLMNFNIAGSCNGLICLFGCGSNSYVYFLWNPLIGKTLSLPSPIFSFAYNYTVGFGFDSKIHDYKVLKICASYFKGKYRFSAEIYSLNSNSWKDITSITPDILRTAYEFIPNQSQTSAFVHGALHWTVPGNVSCGFENSYSIMVFDLSNEIFDEILLPRCIRKQSNNCFCVKEFGESTITVINASRDGIFYCDIWLMKEYGIVSSWMKIGALCELWRQIPSFRCLFSQNLDSPWVQCLAESLALFDKTNDEVQASGTSNAITSRNTKRLLRTTDAVNKIWLNPQLSLVLYSKRLFSRVCKTTWFYDYKVGNEQFLSRDYSRFVTFMGRKLS